MRVRVIGGEIICRERGTNDTSHRTVIRKEQAVSALALREQVGVVTEDPRSRQDERTQDDRRCPVDERRRHRQKRRARNHAARPKEEERRPKSQEVKRDVETEQRHAEMRVRRDRDGHEGRRQRHPF